jgi:chaperonin GroEL (HSP60 family)
MSEASSVIEPVGVKEHIMKSASESGYKLLRIDDVVAGSRKGPSMPPGGMGAWARSGE